MFYPVSNGTYFHIQGSSFILSDYMVARARLFLLQMFVKMCGACYKEQRLIAQFHSCELCVLALH